jgi:hypothetical protein
MDQGRRDTQLQEPILTARPLPTGWVDDLAYFMLPVGFTIVIVGSALLIAFIILPHPYAFAFVFFITAVPSYFLILMPRINRRIELRSSIYTVTRRHVEVKAQTGMFWRRSISRSIAVSDIRDVRVSIDRILRDEYQGSVTITAFNGDSITFADILGAEATGEIIRQLVRELTQREIGNTENENISAWKEKHPTVVKAVVCLCGSGFLALLISGIFGSRGMLSLGLFFLLIGFLLSGALMRINPQDR